MTIVHVAFLGLINSEWTPCPEAPPGRAPMHIWKMGPKDDCVRCMWCHAVAWHTYKMAAEPVKAPRGPCEHGRAPEGPPCSQCPCPNASGFTTHDGHIWISDGGTDSYRPIFQWCRDCHSVRVWR